MCLPKHHGLPAFDLVRLLFMHIRRLRFDGSYGIIGQVINEPVDVSAMVQQLLARLYAVE